MKILAIRGRNIASLEGDFEIDFRLEPLLSAGLFAIRGATGSGKSSLLDTLCLALYDSTPRTAKAKENNVTVADIGGKGFAQNDTRTMLRKGSTEGLAEVEFSAISGQIYKAQWTVKRSREKVDGVLQSANMKLFNISQNREESGTKTELLDKIKDLIGLSFEQFSRSVLLAQGDFASFLKAKQSEKAEILEKVTGTEIYSDISSLIYKKSKDAFDKVKEYELKIATIPVLSDEEIEQSNSELSLVKTQIDSVQKTLSKNQEDLKWIENLNNLKLSVAQGQSAKEKIEADAPAMANLKGELDKIACVQEVRDRYTLWRNNWDQKKKKEEFIGNSKRELVELSTNLNNVSAEKEKNVKELGGWNSSFEKEKSPLLEKAKTTKVKLDEKTTNRDSVNAEYKKSKQDWEANVKSANQAEEDIKKLGVICAQENEWLKEHNSYSVLADPKKNVAENLSIAIEAHKQYAINLDLVSQNKDLLKISEAELETKQGMSNDLEKALPENVLVLRKSLVMGEPCPVCGALDHPKAKNIEVFTQKEEELDKAKAKVKNEIEDLFKSMIKKQNEIQRLIGMADTYLKQLEEKKTFLLPILENGGINTKIFWENTVVLEEVKEAIEQWQTHKEKRENAEKEQNSCIAELKTLNVNLDSEKTRLQQAETKLSDGQKDIDKLNADLVEICGDKSVAEMEKEYSDQRIALEKKLKESEQSYIELGSAIKQKKMAMLDAEKEFSDLDLKIAETQRFIEHWLREHKQIENGKHLEVLLAHKQEEIKEKQIKIDAFTYDIATAKAVLEERSALLQQHLKIEKHADEQTEVETLKTLIITTENDLRKNERRKIELDLLFDTDDKNKKLKVLETVKAEKDKAIYDNWAKLNELFGSADGAKFKQLAQAYTLDILLAYANIHLADLSKRYKLQRIGDTLALQVLDLDMMGEARSVHTLSGGESFLVSLALALGLSSLSSGNMRVESLFIDEGFGSLDADTLQIAMEALERLHSQGRKIGVISHVSEMTEKILCRISVEPTGNGSSKVVCVKL